MAGKAGKQRGKWGRGGTYGTGTERAGSKGVDKIPKWIGKEALGGGGSTREQGGVAMGKEATEDTEGTEGKEDTEDTEGRG